MKIAKIIFGIFLGVCSAGIFCLWAYDGPSSLFDPIKYVQLVPAPKGKAQLVVITAPAVQDGPDYYLGVRGSKGETWRQFLHLFGESIDKPDPVWSGDGSVVALTNKSKSFGAAYDFRQKKFYKIASNASFKSTSRQIYRLLQTRGGYQHSKNMPKSRDLGSWRWQDVDLKELLGNWKE